jgi:hypothetical protein
MVTISRAVATFAEKELAVEVGAVQVGGETAG